MKFPFPFFAPEGDSAAADGLSAPAVEATAPDSAQSVSEPAGAPEAQATAPADAPGASLLSEADGKKPAESAAPAEGEAPKPDAAAEGEAAKTEGAEGETLKEAAPEPITFEPFTLPEGVTLPDESVKALTDILGNRELSPQEAGQKLVDLYLGEKTQMEDAYAKMQAQVWNERIDGWKKEVKGDAELGGNRLNTTLATARATIEEFLPDEGDRAALFEQLNVNGMGNYRPFIKLMNNLGLALNVLEDKIVAAPASGQGASKSRAERWYGGNGKGA